MITNIFGRSNPMNFVVCMLLLLTAFIFVAINKYDFATKFSENIQFLSVFPLLVFSVFLTGFIAKKNNINKGDDYALLLFTLLLLLIPDVFTDFSIIMSNVFVLLAFRRLASLQSLILPKEKIFDASLYIVLASAFEFWTILFLLLVFVSVIIHVSGDFRNWLIPFVGVATATVLVGLCALIFDLNIVNLIQADSIPDFNFDYLTDRFHSFSLGAFVVMILLFLVVQIMSYGNYLATLQNAIKKVITFLMIAFVVYLISNEKYNGLLLYCIAPLSIIGSNVINSLYKKWMKEALIILLLVSGILSFYFCL